MRATAPPYVAGLSSTVQPCLQATSNLNLKGELRQGALGGRNKASAQAVVILTVGQMIDTRPPRPEASEEAAPPSPHSAAAAADGSNDSETVGNDGSSSSRSVGAESHETDASRIPLDTATLRELQIAGSPPERCPPQHQLHPLAPKPSAHVVPILPAPPVPPPYAPWYPRDGTGWVGRAAYPYPGEVVPLASEAALAAATAFAYSPAAAAPPPPNTSAGAVFVASPGDPRCGRAKGYISKHYQLPEVRKSADTHRLIRRNDRSSEMCVMCRFLKKNKDVDAIRAVYARAPNHGKVRRTSFGCDICMVPLCREFCYGLFHEL